MSHIKNVYFHIKGTPKQEEAFECVTDNYVRAYLLYVKGRGYYWSIHRCGKYIYHDDHTGEDVGMECFTMYDRSPSIYECLEPCTRAGKARERKAVELFDSNVFSTIHNRLGYETDEWEVML